MTTLAKLFQNIKLPTMPEVAQSLIKSLNDDYAPVMASETADVIDYLPSELLTKLQVDMP